MARRESHRWPPSATFLLIKAQNYVAKDKYSRSTKKLELKNYALKKQNVKSLNVAVFGIFLCFEGKILIAYCIMINGLFKYRKSRRYPPPVRHLERQWPSVRSSSKFPGSLHRPTTRRG